MGATNEIKGTNLTLKLRDLKCSECWQKFTEEEIAERNFELWFDTTNDVKLIAMEKIKEKVINKDISVDKFNENYWDLLYYPFGRTGYQFSIWIRRIEHESCPDTKLCENCSERFLEEKMKEFETEYYCEPCWKELNKQTK